MSFRGGIFLSHRISRHVCYSIDRRELRRHRYFGNTSSNTTKTTSFFGSLLRFTINRIIGWSILGGGLYLTIPGKFFLLGNAGLHHSIPFSLHIEDNQ